MLINTSKHLSEYAVVSVGLVGEKKSLTECGFLIHSLALSSALSCQNTPLSVFRDLLFYKISTTCDINRNVR